MEFNLLQISISTLLLAVLIDLVFSEPRGLIHVAISSGRFASFLSKHIPKKKRTVSMGWFIVILTEAVILLIFYAIFDFLYEVPDIFFFFLIFYAIILKSTFAFSSMRDHIKPVIQSLESGNVEDARAFLSRVVRRDVSSLDERLIISSSIETISEGITDSFVGSLFYFSLFGVMGSIFYRVINTMDSTIGYRDSANLKLGRPAALMDTILNYIPARISSALIIASAYLLNYNNSKNRMSRMFYSLKSRNAAYTMCAMASQLNIKLEKSGSYIINDKGFDPTLKDLKKTLRIFYLSFGLMIVLITIPLTIISYYLLYPHIIYIFPGLL